MTVRAGVRYPGYGDTRTEWALLGAETMLAREPEMNPRGRWEYEDGLMLDGVYAIYQSTRDRRYLEYIRSNIDRFVQPDGSITGYRAEELNLDHVNNGKAVLNLWEETEQHRYRAAADLLFGQLAVQPRLSSGTFWHKAIYPHQTWLDGLYMASVFYARYARTFGRDDLFDDVTLQFTTAYDLTLDPETGLCRHAYDESRQMPWADLDTGLSPHVWLRALGWFVMAMTDVLEYLPDGPGRATILGNLRELLGSLRAVADPGTGLWYQIPDQGGRPLNYLESSGSFMVLAAVAKGLRCGYLDDAVWAPHLDRAWENAIEQFLTVTAQGWVNVNRICSVAGLGGAARRDGSYAYYQSEPIVANDHKGVGPFLLLASEMRGRRA